MSLEDVSGTLCQVTKFSNMENRWEELLPFIGVLLYAEYWGRCFIYIISHSHTILKSGHDCPHTRAEGNQCWRKQSYMHEISWTGKHHLTSNLKLFWGAYWWNAKDTDQWNKIEHPEIDSHIYHALICEKAVKWIYRESVVFSMNGAGAAKRPCAKQAVGPVLHIFYKTDHVQKYNA